MQSFSSHTSNLCLLTTGYGTLVEILTSFPIGFSWVVTVNPYVPLLNCRIAFLFPSISVKCYLLVFIISPVKDI